MFADLSRNRVDAATASLLQPLARACGLEAQRDAMWAGAAINTTEQRAVLHHLLRKPAVTYAQQAPEATILIVKSTRKQQRRIVCIQHLL